MRAATPLFSSDDHRHGLVLACLTTAYRQVVEHWEMHHLQEAYEMRHMNLGEPGKEVLYGVCFLFMLETYTLACGMVVPAIDTACRPLQTLHL